MIKKGIIGIDLGTTTTLVSFYSGEKPELLHIAHNSHIKETVIRLSKPISEYDIKSDVKIEETGLSAWNNRKYFPSTTYFSFKPEIGETETSNKLDYLWLETLYKIIKERFNGDDLSEYEIVIGIPAKWNKETKEKYKKIAKRAGFNNVHLAAEPIAAILRAKLYKNLENIKEDFYVLFFDFGGGTLDLSLLKIKKTGNIEFIYSGGNPKLGGRDFDSTLTKYFVYLANKENLKVTDENEIDIERQVREAKSKLNEIDSLQIYLKGKIFEITKDDFMNICRNNINEVKTTFENFFEEVKLKKKHLDKNNINEIISNYCQL